MHMENHGYSANILAWNLLILLPILMNKMILSPAAFNMQAANLN